MYHIYYIYTTNDAVMLRCCVCIVFNSFASFSFSFVVGWLWLISYSEADAVVYGAAANYLFIRTVLKIK